MFFYQCGAVLKRGEPHIDFEDVGHFGQRLTRILTHVVIERNQVSGLLQAPASFHHFVIDGHGLKNLDHG